MTSRNHPGHDEVEVALLGRGVGECCVVHLGNKRWMVVDSFLDVSSSRSSQAGTPGSGTVRDALPAARAYLDSMGVDREDPDAVTTIVLTPLDSDHYRGLSDLHAYYEHAQLVIPAALSAGATAGVFGDQASTVLETVTNAVHQAESRGLEGLEQVKTGDRIIDDGQVVVTALSPTPKAQTAMSRRIARLIDQGAKAAKDGTVPSRVENRKLRNSLKNQNLTSIALHVQVGDMTILLGGDVVNHGGFGWKAILSHTKVKQLKTTSLFKTPHHGSKGAHHPQLWGAMVDDDSPMLVAPNWVSDLPGPRMLAVLRKRGEVWQAATSTSTYVDQFGNEQSYPEGTGLVRARRRPGEAAWRVDVEAPGHQVP